MTVPELPRPVEVIPSDGLSLHLALQGGGAVADVSSSIPRRPAPVPVALGTAR